jgi:hypothetical protein
MKSQKDTDDSNEKLNEEKQKASNSRAILLKNTDFIVKS